MAEPVAVGTAVDVCCCRAGHRKLGAPPTSNYLSHIPRGRSPGAAGLGGSGSGPHSAGWSQACSHV